MRRRRRRQQQFPGRNQCHEAADDEMRDGCPVIGAKTQKQRRRCRQQAEPDIDLSKRTGEFAEGRSHAGENRDARDEARCHRAIIVRIAQEPRRGDQQEREDEYDAIVTRRFIDIGVIGTFVKNADQFSNVFSLHKPDDSIIPF